MPMGCNVPNSFSVRITGQNIYLCDKFVGNPGYEANAGQPFCVIPKWGVYEMNTIMLAVKCDETAELQSKWQWDNVYKLIRSKEQSKLVWGMKYHDLFPGDGLNAKVKAYAPYLTLVSIDSEFVVRLNTNYFAPDAFGTATATAGTSADDVVIIGSSATSA